MDVLIIKLGASGDVVRTTSLLHRLQGQVTWLTTANNRALLDGVRLPSASLRVLAWEDRSAIYGDTFDLVINLEDDPETSAILQQIRAKEIFGACLTSGGQMAYTDSSREWFDLSLISRHGREFADRLKLNNRRSYQDLIFSGLGWTFSGETYFLPAVEPSDLRGDVAIAAEAGPVWPMKQWPHHGWLKTTLEERGLRVNVLPRRPTLTQHIADIAAHRCLVGADSLPMHLALGARTPCVAIFNCTSPWEIHDYGLLTKLVSPFLSEFFYTRDNNPRGMNAVSKDSVLDAVVETLTVTASARLHEGRQIRSAQMTN